MCGIRQIETNIFGGRIITQTATDDVDILSVITAHRVALSGVILFIEDSCAVSKPQNGLRQCEYLWNQVE